ncbi:MAG: hypothetical protein K6F69_10015, partial [Treponema sp.]|nr:hypothetical protein [Treponema sp.]
MKKTFYEINKAIRTQIRSRREALNITQQELLRKIGKDFFEDENHFENDKSVLSRLELLPKEPDNSELRNIDFELLYYVCSELELKLDLILFPSGIPSLFTKDAFENSITAKTYNIKHEFLDYIFRHYDDFSKKLKDKKIQLYYNDLLQSGLKTFLPPQISFISGFAAGTTSLIYLLMGIEYKGNFLLPENTDVFYIHSDFKPHFYPEDKNEFEFDKGTFSLQEIFNYRNDFTVKTDKKVTVRFLDVPILKYITIYDTKFVGEVLSTDLIKQSVHCFIVEPEPAFRAKQISQIITILGKNYNSKYPLANDILFRISILLSKKSS